MSKANGPMQFAPDTVLGMAWSTRMQSCAAYDLTRSAAEIVRVLGDPRKEVNLHVSLDGVNTVRTVPAPKR